MAQKSAGYFSFSTITSSHVDLHGTISSRRSEDWSALERMEDDLSQQIFDYQGLFSMGILFAWNVKLL